VHDGGVTAASRAIFVYDGDCAFCSACARFVMRRVSTTAWIEAWQFIDLESVGLTAEECDQAVQWVSYGADGRRTAAAGPAAIAKLLRSSNRFWRGLGRVLERRPVLAAAWPVYRWVARHRDRMPGGTAECALPAAQRARFRAGTGAVGKGLRSGATGIDLG
jgi:predicted DCC family thiol-disulfide oxidoreductase YuxK